MTKISAIICTYNEEKTIKDVVVSVSNYIFDEVIVVNDGSTDNTEKILYELRDLPNLKCLTLAKNKGKGYAMATGVENATGELIVFIDADLSDLKNKHFEQLITPILTMETDMVLGQATETLINYNANPFKFFTGERALLRKDIIPILKEIKDSKFGVETIINLYFLAQKKRIKFVMLNGLKHPTKFAKTTKYHAVKGFLAEGHQIALTTFKNSSMVRKIIKNQFYKSN